MKKILFILALLTSISSTSFAFGDKKDCCDDEKQKQSDLLEAFNKEPIGEFRYLSCMMANCYPSWRKFVAEEIGEEHDGFVKMELIRCDYDYNDGTYKSCSQSDYNSVWVKKEYIFYYKDIYASLKKPIEEKFEKDRLSKEKTK